MSTVVVYDTGTVRGGLPGTIKYGRIKLSADQTGVASLTDTPIVLDSEVSDTDAIVAGGPGVTLTTAGLWMVTCSVQIEGASIALNDLIDVFLTGAGTDRQTAAFGQNNQIVTVSKAVLVRTIAANQALGLSVNASVNSGTATIRSLNDQTYLEAILLQAGS